MVEHPLDEGRHLARIAFQAPELPRRHAPERDAGAGCIGLHVLGQPRRHRPGGGGDDPPEPQTLATASPSSHFTNSVISQYTVEHSAPDDEDVVRSISRLQPHGSTNVQAGLNLGVQLADAARAERPEAFNYVILMSDGVANVDATNPFAILESAADSDSRNPLRLITIGVGIENYNDYLLEQLAQHGNGWYRYLDDTVQAQQTFSPRELAGALHALRRPDARAQLTWDPAVVQAWRIVGYENRITPDHTFEQDHKEFAELPSGASTTVFLRARAPRGRPRPVQRAGKRGACAGWTRRPGLRSARTPASPGTRAPRSPAATATCASERSWASPPTADSSLSPQVEGAEVDYAGIHGDLAALRAELDTLQAQLGSLEAYTDFRFLLDQLTTAAEELAPSSGYSQ